MRTGLTLALAVLAAAPATAQPAAGARLPRDAFDVIAPSERVKGRPGAFTAWQTACRVGPLGPHTRRRIVDIAVQEWAVFGFQTLDYLTTERRVLPRTDTLQLVPDALNPELPRERLARRPLRLGRSEQERSAEADIAGYWTATPDGPRVIHENRTTSEPWSAAFISWTMCEAGLGERQAFARSIAHWEYIDQAIRDEGAYRAVELGSAEIVPGDLLCNARGEPPYRTLAERAPDAGRYAPLHCDVVVKLDAGQGAVFVIGGNVLNSVSLSTLRAAPVNGHLVPVSDIEGARSWFAHLQLKTGPIEAAALDHTPTVANLR